MGTEIAVNLAGDYIFVYKEVERKMSQLILKNRLAEAVRKETFIKYGNEACCKGIKYDFRIKGKYTTPGCCGCKRNSGELSGSTFAVAPGEMAFIATKEELELPGNMFCQLNADKESCLEGILVLDGLCMEPGYRGDLLFGLFNFSAESYSFKAGQKLFSGIFYELEPEEAEMVRRNPDAMYDFVIRPERNQGMFQPDVVRETETKRKEERRNFKLLFSGEWLRENKLLVMVSLSSFLLGGFVIAAVILLSGVTL